jgi:ATP-dependent DNA helicase RecG
VKTSLEQFERWLKQPEGIDLEFKEARSKFDNSRCSLFDYCAAISNGRGGKLILGVREKPREVKGTEFVRGTHQKLSHEVWERLRIHVDVEEFDYRGRRVLIFHIPKHPLAARVKSGGKGDKYTYPVRRGESLGEMDDQRTREILNEDQPDFTAGIVPGLTPDDLDKQAIEVFRQKWAGKAGRKEYSSFDDEKVLKNTGLIDAKGITFGGLILVGKEEALRKYLPDAEIIFEWRHDSQQTHYDFRKNWRGPFISIDDDIWNTINARNLRIPFQEGFFQREIWAFDEKSVREAVHNAVMHRDYSIKGRSVFIKASPREFLIESPGGFPPGITLENVLSEKEWRNRSLAEGFEKIGLAERSSQGLDDIFEKSIRDGKGMPDLSRSDSRSVLLSIPAQVKDKDFILYLERISNERQVHLSFEEIYALERIRDGQKVRMPDFKNKFLKLGIIEPIGKGRGTKYILSQRYYETIGQSGQHTRLKGLSRDRIKEMIMNHIEEGKPCTIESLLTGFPECKPQDLSNMLQELKRSGKIYFKGSRRNGLWKIVH